MRSPLLLACLLLSGFSGLAYELLWVRLLARALGSTTLSFSTVLAVFFGGLALGAYLAGRRVAKVARPARAYALLEFGIAGLALLLYPLLVNFDGIFAAVDPGPGAWGAVARFGASVLLLLAPTMLMGATLPMVISGTVARDADVGPGTALAYGLNTLGAFLGAYGVTFLLLPELGVFKSTLVAAVANIAAGLIALAVDRAPSARHEPFEESAEQAAGDDEAARDNKTRAVAMGLTAIGGFAAICLQVVWVRLFSIFMEGTVYGTGSVLIAVLLGIAVGSILIVPAVSRSKVPELWFVGLQVALLLSVAALAWLLPWLSYQITALGWSRTGTMLPLHGQLALVVAAVAIPTSCAGATFPLLIKMIERRANRAGRSLGTLYAANTVGSISGSLVTGFVLLPSMGSEATTYTGLLLVALTGTLGAVFLSTTVRSLVPKVVMIAAPLLALATFPGFDVRLLTGHAPRKASYLDNKAHIADRLSNTLFFSEGEVATVAATRDKDGNTSLMLSALPQGGRLGAPPYLALESVLVGLVPLLHGGPADRGMVVGLGAGATIDVLLQLGLRHIDVLELEPKVVAAAPVVMGESSALDSPSVQVHINDARHHLLRNARQGGEPYDLITSMPAHPWVASSIFTQDFFRIARENLSDRGIFSTWFGTGKMDRETVQSLLRAFAGTFEHYVAYWVPEVGAYYLVGCKQPLTLDLGRAQALFTHELVSMQNELRIDGPLFLPLRTVGSGTPNTPALPEGTVNTDDTPIVEVRAPRSSTSSPILTDFFPNAYLQLASFPEASRVHDTIALLEAALGTPRGKLPYLRSRARTKLARNTLAAAHDILDEQHIRYFEARLSLQAGKSVEARRGLQTLLTHPTLGDRVGRMLALTYPDDSAERRAAFEALPSDGDVLTAIAEFDFAEALGRVPPERPNRRDDPESFLWWMAAHGATPISDSDRGEFVEAAAEVFPFTARIGLTTLCSHAMDRFALDALRLECERLQTKLRKGRARRLARRGRGFGARGDFAKAARLLQRSLREDSTNVKTQELLLIALVELGAEQEIARVQEGMRLRGLQAAHVAHLVDKARKARTLAESRGEASPWTAPTETSTPAATP